MSVEIRAIEPTKKQLRNFTRFGIDLYEGNPYYVPALINDDVNTLSPKVNPAFDFCKAQCFMAYRDGKPVGRIAGIINNAVNDRPARRPSVSASSTSSTTPRCQTRSSRHAPTGAASKE